MTRPKLIKILSNLAEELLQEKTCDCLYLKSKCICNPVVPKDTVEITNNTSNTYNDGGVNSNK